MTTTFTTTAAEDAIIASAIGYLLHPGTNATQAEVKQFVIQFIKNAVLDGQRQQQQAAISATPINPI